MLGQYTRKYTQTYFYKIWNFIKISSVGWVPDNSIIAISQVTIIHLGPVLQRFYELIIQILRKKSCCYLKNDNQIISQLCTCHGSCTAMPCAKLWPDVILRNKIIIIFTRFLLWALKLFVKQVPTNLMGVSLNSVSSPSEFWCYLIFVIWNNTAYPGCIHCVSIRWRLCHVNVICCQYDFR